MEIKRQQIEHLLGEKVLFEGKFSKYGYKYPKRYGFTTVTMLFTDVYVNGIYIDHMWVQDSKRTRKFNIKEGSLISFTGVVCLYHCGNGYAIDKKRNIEIVKRGNGQNLEEFLIKSKKYIRFTPTYKKIVYKPSTT